jgi:hypothetical protein
MLCSSRGRRRRLSLCVFIVRLLVHLLVPSPALYPCCVVLFLRHLSPEFSPQEAKITFLASALLGALPLLSRWVVLLVLLTVVFVDPARELRFTV